MSTIKKLRHVYSPPAQPGFIGKGHIARPVIQIDFTESDPFIHLMDDMLDKKDNTPAGGPHPHAGFETVTLVIEGEFGEGSQVMRAGDFEMMTAGSGIVHTETIAAPLKLRVLQLWLNLPKKDRWTQPRIQKLGAHQVPSVHANGVKVSVYSGSFAGLSASILNHTPIIIADVKLESGKSLHEQVPDDFTTFIYVLQGSVKAGDEIVAQDQAGWFERSDDPTGSLQLQAGNEGARLILYSAQPQKHPIVSQGFFVADSMDEIQNLYDDYRAGKIEHINDVAR